MTIKQLGGVFGRNPTFNDVTIDGELILNGEIFTGLDFQGSWNASTNTPTLASGVGTTGEFYIVSVAGTTNLDGITNWGVGDWAMFSGSAWQRVEGNADGNFVNLSVSNEATFPDNAKAIFGTGSDLEIYHDGSNSYITDAGTGSLIIDGSSSTQIKGSAFVILRSSAGENMAVGNADGAFDLYYDGSKKLATTDTGIDVTGTATTDGLTVAGLTAINSTTPEIRMNETDTTDLNTQLRSGVGKFEIKTLNDAVTLATKRFEIDHTTGDISFYNDAAAQGLFWDSSASALGIGTSSPLSALNVKGTQGNWRVDPDSVSNEIQILTTTSANDGFRDFRLRTNETIFEAGGSEAMRISSGNLLVGKASADNTTQGIRLLGSAGFASFVRDSAEPIVVNRLTDDGGLIEFRKDGAAVGSIGVNTSDMYLGTTAGTTDNYIRFAYDTSHIVPASSAGAENDAAISLGHVNSRFKDLHLSTNIHQGATTPSSSAAGVLTEAVGRVTYSRGSGTGGFAHASFINGNGTVGSIVTASSATAYNTSSDQRLKENIADADDAGSKIDSIQVRKFDWKADGSHQDYGMVAQELFEVAPEAVSAPEDPDEMMGVDYSKLVPMMLKEIQSLRARIAALES